MTYFHERNASGFSLDLVYIQSLFYLVAYFERLFFPSESCKDPGPVHLADGIVIAFLFKDGILNAEAGVIAFQGFLGSSHVHQSLALVAVGRI